MCPKLAQWNWSADLYFNNIETYGSFPSHFSSSKCKKDNLYPQKEITLEGAAMHVVEQIDQKNLDIIEVKVLITDYTTLWIPMLLFIFCLFV